MRPGGEPNVCAEGKVLQRFLKVIFLHGCDGDGDNTYYLRCYRVCNLLRRGRDRKAILFRVGCNPCPYGFRGPTVLSEKRFCFFAVKRVAKRQRKSLRPPQRSRPGKRANGNALSPPLEGLPRFTSRVRVRVAFFLWRHSDFLTLSKVPKETDSAKRDLATP